MSYAIADRTVIDRRAEEANRREAAEERYLKAAAALWDEAIEDCDPQVMVLGESLSARFSDLIDGDEWDIVNQVFMQAARAGNANAVRLLAKMKAKFLRNLDVPGRYA